jgi:hypothetical protein
MREGKHPVKDRKQAIAIGLAKARKKGEKVPSPPARAVAPRKSQVVVSSGRRNVSAISWKTSRASFPSS